jgi:hypothetical protein
MIGRRRFLQSMGLGAIGAGALGSKALWADEHEAPKRLLIISHCHGWTYESWRLQPDGLSSDEPWEIDLAAVDKSELSEPLAPLYAHRSRLVALDGISLATAELDMDGNRHDTGWVHAWTGDNADFSDSDTRSRSPSIDQLVAAAIARPDRLPSLELSVDANAESGRPIAYAPNGVRLPVANTPLLAWERLFGLTANADPLVLRQREQLAHAYAEYQAVCPQLGRSQQLRLNSHFDLLDDLITRITGLANLTCDAVPEPVTSVASYDENFDAFAELIGAAFACDITRVATLSLGEPPTADFGWSNLSDDVHKGIAHGIYDSPQKHQAMTDYLTLHSLQVARLVSLLESIPDIDGRSVMDNTLIVWGSELGDGWHGYEHWCPVLIGGDWHFPTGRYVHEPHTTPVEILVASGYTAFSGLPHQHLLVSVAQAMGLDVDSVGIEATWSQNADRIDCSGPLGALS